MTVREFLEQFKPKYPKGTIVYFLKDNRVCKSVVEGTTIALDSDTESLDDIDFFEAVSVKGISGRLREDALFDSKEALFTFLEIRCLSLC